MDCEKTFSLTAVKLGFCDYASLNFYSDYCIFINCAYRTCVLIFILQLSGKPTGYDLVRNAEIGNKDFELDVLEEAYTSEHWLVRIYKVCWVVLKKKV